MKFLDMKKIMAKYLLLTNDQVNDLLNNKTKLIKKYIVIFQDLFLISSIIKMM